MGDLEDFVARDLPILCEWLAFRYILFSGFLADQSMESWYSDAMADPLEWHYQWFDSVGLQLPYDVVSDAAEIAAGNKLDFTHKDFDKHEGEEDRAEDTGVRKLEDEVGPEVLKAADDILRQWLPPVLLARLGVDLAEEE